MPDSIGNFEYLAVLPLLTEGPGLDPSRRLIHLPAMRSLLLLLLLCASTRLRLASQTPEAPTAHPAYTLASDHRWLLQPPAGRFDASALLRLPDGTLLTVNDKELPICRIDLGTNGVARLKPQPEWFPLDAVRKASPNPRFAPDTEGIARDEQGRLYICTEGQRWIFRSGPGTGQVERLEIDWSPVQRWFSSKDGNASWEGIAAGGGRLYLANERSTGRIVVVDLASLRVVDDFQVAPNGNTSSDVHYTDLCWYKGALWVLCRDIRKVLRVHPHTHAVMAEFDFASVELDPQNAYITALTYGFVEGLAVDDTAIWLAVDNNGMPRRSAPTDFRPLLLRCPRPDVAAP